MRSPNTENLIERDKPKPVARKWNKYHRCWYECLSCHHDGIAPSDRFCCKCGQRLDWNMDSISDDEVTGL